ncbi:MAG: insulinase family protein [Alphaproteobacteria bacterium]|nr:insulinase family protein [Alphaproteobacteria bacterium]
MLKNPNLYKLKNGIRVLLDPLPNFESLAMYVMIGTGSRNEIETPNHSEFGVSHALEHMLFKGTKRRTATQLNYEVAANGGISNAYTTFNLTAYHMMVLKDKLDFAFDYISDIFLHSTFPEEEFKKEKSIIIQEIMTYMDNPDWCAEELMNQTIFKGGLGHEIAGSIESVAKLTRQDLINYRDATYCPENTIISLSGAGIDNAPEILTKLEKYFGEMKPAPARDYIRTSYVRSSVCKVKPNLEHSYIRIIWPSANSMDKKKNMRSKILANILGQGMHSRLYEEVREKQNLVYYIGMGVGSFEDIGTTQISAQTAPGNVQKVAAACVKVIKELLESKPITADELNRTKAVVLASRTIAMEDTGNRADYFASHMLMYGDLLAPDEYSNELDAITTDDLMNTAREIFANEPSVIIYGAENDCDPAQTTQKFK